mmetsp:Transcript_8257/g.4399  ORF Transcript_8257/g.4399 Transcript_8257/m.4399 type:complete len:99 (-) Transcript_8257:494-790(-)
MLPEPYQKHLRLHPPNRKCRHDDLPVRGTLENSLEHSEQLPHVELVVELGRRGQHHFLDFLPNLDGGGHKATGRVCHGCVEGLGCEPHADYFSINVIH